MRQIVPVERPEEIRGNVEVEDCERRFAATSTLSQCRREPPIASPERDDAPRRGERRQEPQRPGASREASENRRPSTRSTSIVCADQIGDLRGNELEQERAAELLDRDVVPESREAARIGEVEGRIGERGEWNEEQVHGEPRGERAGARRGSLSANATSSGGAAESKRRAGDQQRVRPVDAEVEPEEEAEEGEPRPSIGAVGVGPPAQHRPQNQPREDGREDVRRELGRVGPERPAEGERQRAGRAPSAVAVLARPVESGDPKAREGDDVDERRGERSEKTREEVQRVRR